MPAVERRLRAEDLRLARVLQPRIERRCRAAFEHIGAGRIDVGEIGAERAALIVVQPVRGRDEIDKPAAEAISTASAHSRMRLEGQPVAAAQDVEKSRPSRRAIEAQKRLTDRIRDASHHQFSLKRQAFRLAVAGLARYQQAAENRRFRMAFLSETMKPHQAVAHHRGDRQGARAQTGGPRRDRARRGRAGFRHAGQHQAGGDQGDRERARLEVHRRRRHPGTEGRGVAQVQAREQSRLQAEPDHRRHRRQAGALQRPDGDAEPGRRGDHPGAVLGELSRHGAARGRHAGRGR